MALRLSVVAQDAVKELLTVYEGKRGQADGVVTFLEFLDYYRVSMPIHVV